MPKTSEKVKTLRINANRNILGLLDKLGIAYSRRGPLLQACCMCKHHGGDGTNPTAFSWRTDYGRWVCFTHHCETAYGTDIIGLVRSVLGMNFRQSVQWIEEALASGELGETIVDTAVNPTKPKLRLHEPVVEDRVKFLQPDLSYLVNRGFDPVVLKRYQVGTWRRVGTYMHNRIIFPVRDHEAHLVGFTGRSILPDNEREDKGIRKWLHGRDYVVYPKPNDFFITSLLFNWHNAKKHLGENREVILLEGPLDGMRLEEAGIHNWIATLGTTFTPVQRGLLVDAGVNKLRCGYDGDELPDGRKPGEAGWQRVQKIIGDLMELERVPIPLGMDPGDMKIPEVLRVFA